jgi:hypothetical protein
MTARCGSTGAASLSSNAGAGATTDGGGVGAGIDGAGGSPMGGSTALGSGTTSV